VGVEEIPVPEVGPQAVLVRARPCGIHAARLTPVHPGMTVLVLGAGPIGLLAAVAGATPGLADKAPLQWSGYPS
jgi:threonine dehydrogenase-like Zn-dependent dehydrogenase